MKLWSATVHVLDAKRWTSYDVPRIEAGQPHTAMADAWHAVRGRCRGKRIREVKVTVTFLQVLTKIERVGTAAANPVAAIEDFMRRGQAAQAAVDALIPPCPTVAAALTEAREGAP
jgi:hypothetical protein